MGDASLTTELGRVLVTGGSGFVGANLVATLLDRGLQVRSFDRVPSRHAEHPGLETVVGDMSPTAADPDEALAVRRPDGSWLLDGLLPLDEMKEKLGIRAVPDEALGNYHTVGGFVLALLGHIPKKAERFAWDGWLFEVVDVDRNRVDQVLATLSETREDPAEA